MLPTPVTLSSLRQGDTLNNEKTLLSGQTLTIRRAGGGFAVVAARSTAIVLTQDLSACKNKVDVIDTVLIPSSPPPR